MTFLMAALFAGRCAPADMAARLAAATFDLGNPDTSPSQSTIGGQTMWL